MAELKALLEGQNRPMWSSCMRNRQVKEDRYGRRKLRSPFEEEEGPFLGSPGKRLMNKALIEEELLVPPDPPGQLSHRNWANWAIPVGQRQVDQPASASQVPGGPTSSPRQSWQQPLLFLWPGPLLPKPTAPTNPIWALSLFAAP